VQINFCRECRVIRINKLTDYGIVIAVRIAKGEPERLHTAREIAEDTHVPQPTVTRLLKQLARSGILTSTRGAAGGYSLTQPAETISVARLVEALEGPIALTECSNTVCSCALEDDCAVEAPWQTISLAVRNALETVTLADMAQPSLAPPLIPLGGVQA